MAFDNTEPNQAHAVSACASHILANFVASETALNREHEFVTGGTAADQAHHKKGSARCYIQDAAPTTRVDGSAFNVQDNGSLWIDTNSLPDNQFNFLSDYSGPTWTPISTEIIAVLLASNRIFAGTLKSIGNFEVNAKFTVAADTGNTEIAGTAYVVGDFQPTTYSTLRGGFQNSDTMASAADNKTASSDSIVKYATLDAGGVLMHDAEGSFNNCDVNGTKTKVYTKYFTGNLDADSETSVAHSIASATTKILSVTAMLYDDDQTVYCGPDRYIASDTDRSFRLSYDATNIILTQVGSYLQGNAYKIKIDYIL